MNSGKNIVVLSVIFTLIAVGLFFTFQKNKSNNNEPSAGIEPIEVIKPPKPVKIPRSISYTGRIEEAEKLMEHEYYSLATSELAEAIKQKPDLIEPYKLLGEIYLRTGDVWKLDNLLTEMESKFPTNSNTLVLKTRQFITARKFTEVSETLEAQTTLPPELLFYKAVLRALKNDHDGAKEVLSALDEYPVKSKEFKVTDEGATTENEKPTIDQTLNDKVNAIEIIYLEFEELAEWKNAHLFAEFSKALSENNEALLAREFADIAIKEDVKYIDGWILRGYANLTLRKYGAAEADFRQAYELDPLRPETQYFLALALYEQDKFDEAALFFEKALDYNFEFSSEVRWKLLDIFAKQKKYDQVIELYRQLLDEDTDPEKFVTAINTALESIKEPEIALEFSTILIESDSQSAFNLNLHAWALIANKKFVEAEQFLNQALKFEPSNPRTQLNLGLLYESQDKFDAAKAYYKNAYEVGQEQPDYVSVVNLAVEKYNQLVEKTNPSALPASDNPANSP